MLLKHSVIPLTTRSDLASVNNGEKHRSLVILAYTQRFRKDRWSFRIFRGDYDSYKRLTSVKLE